MSGGDLNWEQLPEAVVEAFSERLHLVELLLDPLLPQEDKQAEQRRYQHQHGVGERTIRGYLHRYRKRGPRGLLFYRPRPTSPRVHDAALRAKLLQLIHELPTRSVPQLRKLIAADAKLGAKIARISDRTLYRFLADHGFTKSARYLMLADDARTSFRAFEAPHALALVQADARDGIWLDTPKGRKKTYLFLWLDDFSRKILFGKYYFDEKLPALLDSFRYCLLRYGIPLRVYVDNGKVYVSRHLLAILVELHIKRVRHPPYQAYCKGKIEAANKIIKNQFQREAQVSGIRTIDELNSAFWAWMDLEYNTRVPLRYRPESRCPLCRRPAARAAPHYRSGPVQRVVPVARSPHRQQVRQDQAARQSVSGHQRRPWHRRRGPLHPYDLVSLAIYDDAGALLETTSASRQVTAQVPNVPAESAAKPAQVSAAARAYFTRLREQHHGALRDRTQTSFTQFQSTDDHNKEHRDADA